jgi:hypothetical protein
VLLSFPVQWWFLNALPSEAASSLPGNQIAPPLNSATKAQLSPKQPLLHKSPTLRLGQHGRGTSSHPVSLGGVPETPAGYVTSHPSCRTHQVPALMWHIRAARICGVEAETRGPASGEPGCEEGEHLSFSRKFCTYFSMFKVILTRSRNSRTLTRRRPSSSLSVLFC